MVTIILHNLIEIEKICQTIPLKSGGYLTYCYCDGSYEYEEVWQATYIIESYDNNKVHETHVNIRTLLREPMEIMTHTK